MNATQYLRLFDWAAEQVGMSAPHSAERQTWVGFYEELARRWLMVAGLLADERDARVLARMAAHARLVADRVRAGELG